MNLVYICRDGENEELRYSLRSVCQNIENPRVWVVGGKPDWYTGNHLKVKQSQTKYQNVVNNLDAIVRSPEIPNDFVIMNDDFFIIKPIDKVETYHGGLLKDKIDLFSQNLGSSFYIKLLKNTQSKLKGLGIEEPLDYSIHVPMEFNKEKLSTVIKPRLSYRTLYGNIYGVGGTQINDVKKHRGQTMSWANNEYQDLPYLSSSDTSFADIHKSVLKDMFPDPCRFEKKSRVNRG